MNLADYLLDTRYLLRDLSGAFYSTVMLKRHINSGREQIAKRTGCIRHLLTGQSALGAAAQPGIIVPGGMQPGALPGSDPGGGIVPVTTTNSFMGVPNQELYTFQWANKYLQKQFQGVQGIIDIVDLAVSWGTWKPTLQWMPWEEFQAYCRVWNTGMTAWSLIWATNGTGTNQEVWIYPPPATPTFMDWACMCLPKHLNGPDDWDALPENYQDAVKYYAAHRALMPTRPEQSQLMIAKFLDVIGTDQLSGDFGKVPDYYGDDEP